MKIECEYGRLKERRLKASKRAKVFYEKNKDKILKNKNKYHAEIRRKQSAHRYEYYQKTGIILPLGIFKNNNNPTIVTHNIPENHTMRFTYNPQPIMRTTKGMIKERGANEKKYAKWLGERTERKANRAAIKAKRAAEANLFVENNPSGDDIPFDL
jgi:hypothetical protein